MEVTGVKIYPYQGMDQIRLLAFASIALDDEMAVHNLRVIRGQERLFVSMPSKRLPDGRNCDLCHPTKNGLRERIEAAVLEAYRAKLKEMEDGQ